MVGWAAGSRSALQNEVIKWRNCRVNSLFVAVQFALVALRRMRVEKMQRQQVPGARAIGGGLTFGDTRWDRFSICREVHHAAAERSMSVQSPRDDDCLPVVAVWIGRANLPGIP